jgi:hypothetical protein
MGTQTLIAHKNSRFIKLWLESYKDNYRSNKWQYFNSFIPFLLILYTNDALVYYRYYNAGERPTTEILLPKPHLIHRVKNNFGADTGVSMSLYKNPKFDWRHLDVIHLLMSHRSYSKYILRRIY